jgi:hypothetical protein
VSEQLITYLAIVVISLFVGFLFRAWLARTKSADLEAEALKVIAVQIAALKRLGDEDEIIAAATARKAAKAAALAALKDQVAAL